MGYAKVIHYGNYVETYDYEGNIRNNGRKKRANEMSGNSEDISAGRKDIAESSQQKEDRRKDNARRSVLAFKRLVAANLGEFNKPILLSLTYAENIESIEQGHEDFNAFARNIRHRFGPQIRYICVAEWQKRGAIHFHTLLWGLSTSLVETERSTRLFASLWKQGFIDLVQTDGSQKIASYLSKYMAKAFLDPRLRGKKAYIASRNILRPVIDKNTLLLPYFYGYKGIDLSTAITLHEKEYETLWLGKGRYKLYQLIHN